MNINSHKMTNDSFSSCSYQWPITPQLWRSVQEHFCTLQEKFEWIWYFSSLFKVVTLALRSCFQNHIKFTRQNFPALLPILRLSQVFILLQCPLNLVPGRKRAVPSMAKHSQDLFSEFSTVIDLFINHLEVLRF